jgi:GNAT superfamily N-acetyltransferase
MQIPLIVHLFICCFFVVHGYIINIQIPTGNRQSFSTVRLLLHQRTCTSIDNDVTQKATIHVFTDCNDEIIKEVSTFLIDAYWLSTPRLWTNEKVECNIPTQVSILQETAADYLRTQYGERLGKRLLKTCIVVAEGVVPQDDVSAIAGLLCMHELVWDNDNILPDEESETLIRNSIASLGPKDRRMYKDASTIDIATKLLPPSTKAVCVFSNLAVSTKFRRQGIAIQLCHAAEKVAKKWGYDHLHLKVEAENIAAANLYQDKLGYSLEQHLPTDPAIRLDLLAALFVDTEVETLILSKNLQ